MIKNSLLAFIFLAINTNVFASNEVKFTIKDFKSKQKVVDRYSGKN
tara:strand:+ start:322 stop:459 length:138 start_codon:yes stop_codon:yes gene_type:complete